MTDKEYQMKVRIRDVETSPLIMKSKIPRKGVKKLYLFYNNSKFIFPLLLRIESICTSNLRNAFTSSRDHPTEDLVCFKVKNIQYAYLVHHSRL